MEFGTTRKLLLTSAIACVVFLILNRKKLGRTKVYSYGGEPIRQGVDRDPYNLIPAFADKIEKLFVALRARGYKPLLWEGRRTPARAAMLERRGTGIADSIHNYGGAVDIVDASTAPRYWDGAPGFWTALKQEAERLGLTSGSSFSSQDLPHVQAISVRQQVAFRNTNDVGRASMVA